MNRDQFEKWARQNGYIVDAIDGNYQVSSTIHAWHAWQEQQKRIDGAIKHMNECGAGLEDVYQLIEDYLAPYTD